MYWGVKPQSYGEGSSLTSLISRGPSPCTEKAVHCVAKPHNLFRAQLCIPLIVFLEGGEGGWGEGVNKGHHFPLYWGSEGELHNGKQPPLLSSYSHPLGRVFFFFACPRGLEPQEDLNHLVSRLKAILLAEGAEGLSHYKKKTHKKERKEWICCNKNKLKSIYLSIY